jgi:hypothetical protein
MAQLTTVFSCHRLPVMDDQYFSNNLINYHCKRNVFIKLFLPMWERFLNASLCNNVQSNWEWCVDGHKVCIVRRFPPILQADNIVFLYFVLLIFLIEVCVSGFEIIYLFSSSSYCLWEGKGGGTSFNAVKLYENNFSECAWIILVVMILIDLPNIQLLK